jgi:AcrR family transcriptional regulator
MGARAGAVAETKARIVAAAMALHAKRGVQATRWEEIAEKAEVSVATMYRHFPSLKELVPACARTVFDLIRPLTLEEATSKFVSIRDPAERLAALVQRNVHCYGLGEDWLHAAYRERDFIPELDAALHIIQETVQVLIEATAGRRASKADEATLFALLDFPFYKSLRSAGLDQRTTEKVLMRLVLDVEKESRRKK